MRKQKARKKMFFLVVGGGGGGGVREHPFRVRKEKTERNDEQITA